MLLLELLTILEVCRKIFKLALFAIFVLPSTEFELIYSLCIVYANSYGNQNISLDRQTVFLYSITCIISVFLYPIIFITSTAVFCCNVKILPSGNFKVKRSEIQKVFQSKKKKRTNRIIKICYGHLFMRQENLSFINNYII
jgi:hypothetical protein